jgi:hypothetical protein
MTTLIAETRLPEMEQMDESKLVGSELIVSILKEAGKPLTTRQLQEETQKIHTRCLSSSIVALNIMRIRGTIKGKRTEDKSWVWWVDN